MRETIERIHLVPHPDDKLFDELRLRTVERWKESELSGDEYRFSYRIELLRKQSVVAWTSFNHLEYAASVLASVTHLCLPDLEIDRHWETMAHEDLRHEGWCCQPGCTAQSSLTYVLKKRWSERCDFSGPNGECGTWYAREFCNKHRERGDCGLDDADANYVEVTHGTQALLPGDIEKLRA